MGSNILALEAASARAKEIGYETLILSSVVEGETREVARVHTAMAKEIVKTGRPIPPPACIISGGETTVTIRGDGLGGRNQEFGLAACLDLVELPPRVVLLMLSGGTDGKDAGMKAAESLARNDAYHFFEKTKDHIMTGPTNRTRGPPFFFSFQVSANNR